MNDILDNYLEFISKNLKNFTIIALLFFAIIVLGVFLNKSLLNTSVQKKQNIYKIESETELHSKVYECYTEHGAIIFKLNGSKYFVLSSEIEITNTASDKYKDVDSIAKDKNSKTILLFENKNTLLEIYFR